MTKKKPKTEKVRLEASGDRLVIGDYDYQLTRSATRSPRPKPKKAMTATGLVSELVDRWNRHEELLNLSARLVALLKRADVSTVVVLLDVISSNHDPVRVIDPPWLKNSVVTDGNGETTPDEIANVRHTVVTNTNDVRVRYTDHTGKKAEGTLVDMLIDRVLDEP